jgi:hypothetical protein
MAQNFPGPYEMRFFYEATVLARTFEHTFRLNVDCIGSPDVGDNSAGIDLETYIGGGRGMEDFADDLVNVIKTQFNTGVTFNRVELWQYAASSFDATFITSYTQGISGTSGAATVPASQNIYTFRTSNGGIAKLDLRHTIGGTNPAVFYPTANAPIDAIFAEISDSATGCALGRDNGKLVSPLKWLGGINEKLVRELYR